MATLETNAGRILNECPTNLGRDGHVIWSRFNNGNVTKTKDPLVLKILLKKEYVVKSYSLLIV